MSPERLVKLGDPVDFGEELGDLHLVASAVAHDGALWLLGLEGTPDLHVERNGARFPKSLADREQAHVALRVDERGGCERRRLPADRRNLHHVQPLPGGRLIVSSARCYEEADGSPERNALVIGRDGTVEAALVLGDAIEDLQATSKGTIWASYFDEGTGTRGRGELDPVGASGLVAFDDTGNRLRTFDPSWAGTDAIVDCYAMNVASDAEVWVYFYTEFSLVRWTRDEKPRKWTTGIRGARTIAVGRGLVLLDRGYDASDCFLLCRLGQQALEPIEAYRFADEKGDPLGAATHGRAGWLHFLRGTSWYRVELRRLVDGA